MTSSINWLPSDCFGSDGILLSPIGEWERTEPMRNTLAVIRIDHLLAIEFDSDGNTTSNVGNWKALPLPVNLSKISRCQRPRKINRWLSTVDRAQHVCFIVCYIPHSLPLIIKANNQTRRVGLDIRLWIKCRAVLGRQREERRTSVSFHVRQRCWAYQQDQSPCWSVCTGGCIFLAVSKRKNREANQSLSIMERTRVFPHILIDSIAAGAGRANRRRRFAWQMVVRDKHTSTWRIINRFYFLFQKIFAMR